MKVRRETIVLFLVVWTILAAWAPAARADVVDDLFADQTELSGVLIDKVGALAVKLLHPTSQHVESKATRGPNREIRFQTDYKGWLKAHQLIWEISFNDAGKIKDVVFLQDTNRFKTIPVAEAFKQKVIDYLDEYKRKRLESR